MLTLPPSKNKNKISDLKIIKKYKNEFPAKDRTGTKKKNTFPRINQ
jgi:hypothetical protein